MLETTILDKNYENFTVLVINVKNRLPFIYINADVIFLLSDSHVPLVLQTTLLQGKGYNVCFDRLPSKNSHLICLSANLLSKITEARPLKRNSLSFLCIINMHYKEQI